MSAVERISPTPLAQNERILLVNNIEVIYDHVILVLKGVSLEVPKGGIVALLGANGAGKTTTLKAISNLLHAERGDVTKGSIVFDQAEVQDLMARVGLNPEHFNRYPNEFSGGQRQRIGIARAIALRPKLVVCDEPVSALDVSIQAQVVNLLEDLQDEFQLAYVFIAHDLSVVRHISDRIAVMYLGRIMEIADAEKIYSSPRHPYTRGLMGAVPKLGAVEHGADARLAEIPGMVPSLKGRIEGCVFAGRCPDVTDLCRAYAPALEPKAPGHLAACHYAPKDALAA